jgi:hypothetical protein
MPGWLRLSLDGAREGIGLGPSALDGILAVPGERLPAGDN